MEKYVYGRDGVMFLDNDNNGVLTQITGKAEFLPGFFEELAAVHMARRRRCAELGCTYLHIIVPNKETSLRAYLPDGVVYEEFGPAPVPRYLAAAPAVGEFTFYDADLLSEGETPEKFYPRQDSHWNSRGAANYLRRALEVLQVPDAARMQALEFREVSRPAVGDLGLHAGAAPEEVFEIELAAKANRVLFGGNLVNLGYTRHQIAEVAGLPARRLLCLHDSFTQMLFDVLGNVWWETLSLHLPDLPWDLVEALRPDVVMFIQAERFLPRVPVDGRAIGELLREQSGLKDVDASTADYVEALMTLRRPV